MNSFKKISKKIFFLIIIFIFSLIFSNSVSAQSFNSNFDFYRSLKVGDQGQDVLELQKILNQDSETAVAISGIGSVGNETTYFGNLTKTALIRFQNKYHEEVLAPVSLSVGTGYFGPSTISFIEDNSKLVNFDTNVKQPDQASKGFDELLAQIIASRESAEKESIIKAEVFENPVVSQPKNLNREYNDSILTTDQSKLIQSDSMEVYYVSQNIFESGVELTVVGTGINKDSEIYFFNFENDKVIDSVKIDSNFIFFDAPNLPEGKYELYIKNENFISKPLVVEIVDNYNPPEISSVSPSDIEYGDTVTIKGSNFESQNTVMTALGTYQASLGANSSEIKFFVQRPPNLNFNEAITSPKKQKIEGVIQVQNTNGISDAKFVDFIYN